MAAVASDRRYSPAQWQRPAVLLGQDEKRYRRLSARPHSHRSGFLRRMLGRLQTVGRDRGPSRSLLSARSEPRHPGPSEASCRRRSAARKEPSQTHADQRRRQRVFSNGLAEHAHKIAACRSFLLGHRISSVAMILSRRNSSSVAEGLRALADKRDIPAQAKAMAMITALRRYRDRKAAPTTRVGPVRRRWRAESARLRESAEPRRPPSVSPLQP